MGEFQTILVASVLAFALMYLFITAAPNINFSPSGHFLAGQDKYMHTTVAENAAVSSTLFEIAKANGTVSDSLGGAKTVTLPFSTKPEWFGKHGRGLLELTVTKAGSGELVATINGQEIYRGEAKPGKTDIVFDKDMLTDEDVLEISASKGMAVWTTSEYDIRAEIKGEIISTVNTTFLTPTKYTKAVLLVAFGRSEGKMTVKLNGQAIYEGEPDQMTDITLDKLQKSNTVEFIPDTGTSHLISWAEIRFE
jgi:hypothetical protein